MKTGFYDLANLMTTQSTSGKRYLEFLRIPPMSAGIYVLPAGGTDPQKPHSQDELYYVIKGKARFRAGNEAQNQGHNEDREVSSGSLIFVATDVEHRFYDIQEDLEVLVFFAPAESD